MRVLPRARGSRALRLPHDSAKQLAKRCAVRLRLPPVGAAAVGQSLLPGPRVDQQRIEAHGPAAAKHRIDRLERIGVIAGYRVILDHARLGSRIEAFVELRFAGATQVDDIERTVAGMPEVVEAFTTAGDPDALVRVPASDLDHLKRVVDRIRRSGKVTGTKTLIVLGSVGGG